MSAKSKGAKERPSRRGDRLLRCERCGLSFLWTSEEQKDSTEPELCAGCRFLLPVGARERGIVKWYSNRKQYGFVVRNSGEEIFTHRSRLQGVNRLTQGDLIEFEVAPGEKGPIAEDVRLLASASDLDQADGPESGASGGADGGRSARSEKKRS